jgi:hypothetical protein
MARIRINVTKPTVKIGSFKIALKRVINGTDGSQSSRWRIQSQDLPLIEFTVSEDGIEPIGWIQGVSPYETFLQSVAFERMAARLKLIAKLWRLRIPSHRFKGRVLLASDIF